MQTLAFPWDYSTAFVEVGVATTDAAELQAELTAACAGGRDRHDLYRRLDAVAERHDLACLQVNPSPHERPFALERRRRWLEPS